jgi:non-heme chloroperoxidase
LAVSRFRTDDGIELYYEVWGDGDPTLFYIPVWSESLELMRWAQPLASEGMRIVAFERRGTGRSDRPAASGDRYTVERLTADAVGLAGSLRSTRLVAMAAFEAAHQGVRLAAERRGLVAGLVLTGPLLAPNADRAMQVMWEEMLAKGMGYALRSVADLALSNLRDEQRERWARGLEGHVEADVLLAMFRSIGATESRPYLDRVGCPTLVFAGSQDVAVPRQWSARTAERLADGRLVELPGAGPAAYLTHATEMRAAILDLAQRL